jgi:hypothetical protein
MNQSMSHATLSLICCIAHFFHHDLPPGRFERTHWSSMSSSSSRRVRAVPQDLSRRRFHCHHRLRLVSDTWESVVSWDFHEIFMRFSWDPTDSIRFLQPAARCSSVYASQGPKSSVCIVSVVSIVSIAPVSNRNREGSAACQNDKKIHIWSAYSFTAGTAYPFAALTHIQVHE